MQNCAVFDASKLVPGLRAAAGNQSAFPVLRISAKEGAKEVRVLNNVLRLDGASSASTASATAISAQVVLLDYDATALDKFSGPSDDEALLVATPAPLLFGWVAHENCATYYYADPRIDVPEVVAHLIEQMS
jgi:hypothetical protein